MRLWDRLIGVFVLILIAAVALPVLAPAFTTVVVTATVCFIAIKAALYFTSR